MEPTPWNTILNSFLRAFDARGDSGDIQLANVRDTNAAVRQSGPEGGRTSALELCQKLPHEGARGRFKDTQKTISMRSYLKIVENMKKELEIKWRENDKVGSLQIAIQACKLLHDTSNAVLRP